jgi:hypothetical protein
MCQDERCGWKRFYSALLNINYFPCIHEAGVRTVSFFDPKKEQQRQHRQQRQQSTDVAKEFVVVDYNGDWTIPQREEFPNLQEIDQEFSRSLMTEEDLDEELVGDSDSESMSGFLSTLITELVRISEQDLPYMQLSLTIAAKYGIFSYMNDGDTPENRSAFRVKCCLEAENGDISLW